jgi:hypothetical protein
MSHQGHVTLYRFEAGREPINMWRFYCYHQRPFGAVWMGIRGGTLAGGDHRYTNRPETAWWFRPTVPNHRATNPILVLQDDGNMVLYSRDPQGNILPLRRNGWATGTEGSYPAAIDSTLPTVMVQAGTLAINANTIIENTLSEPINISDGQTAVVLKGNQSVGAYSHAGPGTLAIEPCVYSYNLETGTHSMDAVGIRPDRNGNTIRLIQGLPTPFESHRAEGRNFSNFQLPWESTEFEVEYLASGAEQSGEPEPPSGPDLKS